MTPTLALLTVIAGSILGTGIAVEAAVIVAVAVTALVLLSAVNGYRVVAGLARALRH